MCGIAGGVWSGGSENIQRKIDAALESMWARGPDSCDSALYRANKAVVGLAHCRLSIIDLTIKASQPMLSADGLCVISYNGEVYNYKEIKSELEGLGVCFSTQSDTEVLLAAWSYWGEACLVKLVGMFAFVIYDVEAGTLTCVRDAFGIKPLYYTVEKNNFLFASDIPALIEMMDEPVKLSLQKTYEYLVHGYYDVGRGSFFDGVFRLEPASMIVVEVETGLIADSKKWWEPKISLGKKCTYNNAVNKVRKLFLESIYLHLRSDVKVGAALSGGVDSSAIVCAMSYLAKGSKVNTFSYISDGMKSEEYWVDVVNKFTKANPKKVKADSKSLFLDLNDLIKSQGEPFGSSSIYAQYRVFKAAQESGVVVMLDGQGADELLAGYLGYPGPRLHSLWEEKDFFGFLRFIRGWSRFTGLSIWKGAAYFFSSKSTGGVHQVMRKIHGRKMAPNWIDCNLLVKAGVRIRYPQQVFPYTKKKRRLVSELALSISRRGLPGLLRHADRNSMRFSIESRVPFLTIELAEYLLSLPEEYLVSKYGESKNIFRSAMKGIVPNEILERKDKIGFETPEYQWIVEHQEEVRGILEYSRDVAFLNRDLIIRYFEDVVSGKTERSFLVWRWMNFLIWHRVMIVGESC